jgi:hypothetical protein
MERMKRVLNLNDFSAPALKAILLIGVGSPLIFLLTDRILSKFSFHLPALQWIAWNLVKAGGILLAFFFVLVIVEQIQDHLLYRQYLQNRAHQPSENQSDQECPFCGNRQLHPFETFCPVCGEPVRRKSQEEAVNRRLIPGKK